VNLAALEGVWIVGYVALLILPIAALVDVLRYRSAEWDQVASSKTTWIIGLIVGVVFCGPIGTILGVLYFATAARELRANRAGA
jgi:hypothetical protein